MLLLNTSLKNQLSPTGHSTQTQMRHHGPRFRACSVCGCPLGNTCPESEYGNADSGRAAIRLEKHESCLFRSLGNIAQTAEAHIESLNKYKKWIQREYEYVTEYNSLSGEYVPLSERYTQPLIIMGHREKREREEEMCSVGESFQQLLISRNNADKDSSILDALFCVDDKGISPCSVILQGNSGNGKSFTTQKIMLDWASGNLHGEEFDCLFHLKCKELNHISGEQSLAELLSHNSNLTPDQISQILQKSPEKVLILIDGFDELRFSNSDTSNKPKLSLVSEKAPPEASLSALLRGHILSESFLLVTTRSTATETLGELLKHPQRFTEIIGFSQKQVEEYFQRFFQDEELFRKAFECVKANETLITACSIPVICWIICTTIKERFRGGADVTSGLETTTSIYVDFVSTLLKYHCQGLSQPVPILLRSLGQLAERGMLKQQVLFDEESMHETVSDSAKNPFLCKFLFKRRIRQETMFSFMHLSFQEFFTALYFVILGEEESQIKLTQLIRWCSPNLAAVVPFAFGLLNKDVRHTLKKTLGLFVHPNTEALLKKCILEELQGNIYPHRTLFILHCLYELHEEDFVMKAMKSWNRINAFGSFFRKTDCWALLYCSHCCQSIEELDLLDCSGLTPEKLMMILPALPKFKKITLLLEDPSVSDLVELMCALTRGQTLEVWFTSNVRTCTVCRAELSIGKEELSRIFIRPPPHVDRTRSLELLGLTLPYSELNNINWTKLFQIIHKNDSDALKFIPCSFSKLKKMEISVDCLTERWCVWTLQIIQNCPSQTEVYLDAGHRGSDDAEGIPGLIMEEAIKLLKESTKRPDCILNIGGFRCSKSSDRCTPQTKQIEKLSCNQRVTIKFCGEKCTEDMKSKLELPDVT